MCGIFDSWECGAYHIQHFLGDNKQFKLYYRKFYKYMTNVELKFDIIPCDAPWDKINYGGTLSSLEWHRLQSIKNQELQEYFKDFSIMRGVIYKGNPEERKQDLEYKSLN
jgi:hypothetical protein